jgi:hypothetical protein
MANLFQKANITKHKKFYDEVESLYNNLKQKYDPNNEHASIMKSLDIKNGDTIVIKAKSNNDGIIAAENIDISKLNYLQPLMTVKDSTQMDKANSSEDKAIYLDDFMDDESVSSEDSDSIKTVSSGNFIPEYKNDVNFENESYTVDNYIIDIGNLNSLSNEIYDTLHRIYTDNIVVFTTKIIKDEKVLRFIEHINKIITLFITYIDNSFKYYNTVITRPNLRFENGEIKRKNEHFKNELNKFDNHYKDFINNIDKKNSNDYKNMIIYEKEFFLVIVESCNFLYKTINDNKSLFEKDPISYSFYIDTNKLLIQNLQNYKNEFYTLYNDVFSVNKLQKTQEKRPLSAGVKPSVQNAPILTSRSENNMYPSNVKTAIQRNYPSLTMKNNPNRRGGAIYLDKKNTRKRHLNKKYTISRKGKNSSNIMKKKLRTKKRFY